MGPSRIRGPLLVAVFPPFLMVAKRALEWPDRF